MRNLIHCSFASLVILSSLSCLPAHAQMLGTPAWSQVYESKELGLSFSYSATLIKEDPKRLYAREFAVFQLQPGSPVLSPSAPDVCSHVVLALSTGLDRPEEKPKKGQPFLPVSRGTLTLTEVEKTCLDSKQLEDTLVSSLIHTTTQETGMRPLAHVTNYSVQGKTVWWATAAGYAKNETGVRDPKAGTLIQGTAGTAANGHFLIWSITANDAEAFNKLAGISICFQAPACPEGFTRLVQTQLAAQRPVETASRE